MNGCQGISSPSDTLSTSCQNKGCYFTLPEATVYTNTRAGRYFFTSCLTPAFRGARPCRVTDPRPQISATWWLQARSPLPSWLYVHSLVFARISEKLETVTLEESLEVLIKFRCPKTTASLLEAFSGCRVQEVNR